jgi:hypothetical protein
VTLNDQTTVVHLGDADTRDVHFKNDEELWSVGEIDAAFPPYWFFTSTLGSAVLQDRLKPRMSIGIHVPIKLNPAYSTSLDQQDLFRVPGETRIIAD